MNIAKAIKFILMVSLKTVSVTAWRGYSTLLGEIKPMPISFPFAAFRPLFAHAQTSGVLYYKGRQAIQYYITSHQQNLPSTSRQHVKSAFACSSTQHHCKSRCLAFSTSYVFAWLIPRNDHSQAESFLRPHPRISQRSRGKLSDRP
jgi:hypothetical protein